MAEQQGLQPSGVRGGEMRFTGKLLTFHSSNPVCFQADFRKISVFCWIALMGLPLRLL